MVDALLLEQLCCNHAVHAKIRMRARAYDMRARIPRFSSCVSNRDQVEEALLKFRYDSYFVGSKVNMCQF